MQQWQIGGIRITRIEEMLGPLFDPVRFFPDWDPAVIEKEASWLLPDHFDTAKGNIVASMHSWLIQTPAHNILVDTCIGDDKERLPYRNWHRMKSGWFDQFLATGLTPDDIDYVMCTHLHVDHVGWNTRLVDGQWVPTFANARYLMAKTEFEFWEAQHQQRDAEGFDQVNAATFSDSVMPVRHLADLVEGERAVSDHITLEPAAGHTPGSMVVRLRSEGQTGVCTGDICHHPLQVCYPHWNSAFCELPDAARVTRQRILAGCRDDNTLMLPAHFGGDHAGYVRPRGDAFRFEFISPGGA